MENMEQQGAELDGQPWSLQDPLAARPTVVAEKIKILSDPNIATKVVAARRIFFLRISHEFMRIQFLLCGSLELAKVAAGTWESPFLTPKNKAILSLATYTMFRKAELYNDKLQDCFAEDYFNSEIAGFDLYKESSVFGFDREYMKKIASLEEIPGSPEALKYVERVLKVNFLRTEFNTSQLSFLGADVSVDERLRLAGKLIKECTTALTQVQSLLDGKFSLAFKHHNTLLLTLCDEAKTFDIGISDPTNVQPFDWNRILLHKLNKTVGNYTFTRISPPQDDYQASA